MLKAQFYHKCAFLAAIIVFFLLNSCSSTYSLVKLNANDRKPYKGDTITFKWKTKQAWKFDSVFFEGEKLTKNEREIKIVADSSKRYVLEAYTTEGKKVRKYFNVRVQAPRLVSITVPDTLYNDTAFRFSWSVRNADKVAIKGLSEDAGMRGSKYLKFHRDTVIHLTMFGKNSVVEEKQFPIKVIYADTIDLPEFFVKKEPQRVYHRFEGVGKAFILPMKDSIPLEGRYIMQFDSTQPLQVVLNRFGQKDTLIYMANVIEPEFEYVNATYSMLKGQIGFIEWEVEGADSIFIYERNKYFPASGRINISPEYNEKYHLQIKRNGRILTQRVVDIEVFERRYVEGEIDIDQIRDKRLFYYDITAVDLSEYPEKVKLQMIVVDDYGNFVKNMAPPYGNDAIFKKYVKGLVVKRFGKEKPIGFTVKEVRELQSDPYDIALTLDYSGSMFHRISALNEGVKTFIMNKNKFDRISITKYDHTIKTYDIFSTDPQQLIEAGDFNGISGFGGRTALYAATDKATEKILGTDNSKALILFSDGYENASFQYQGQLAVQPNALAKKLMGQNLKIHTVAFGRGANVDLMKSLAELFDGKFYYADNPQQVLSIFKELPYIMHNYYEVSFKTEDLVNGKNKIKLRVFDNKDSIIDVPRIIDIKKKIDLTKYENNEYVKRYYPDKFGDKKPVTVPQTVVTFDFDKSYIKSEFYEGLSKYVRYLKAHRTAALYITGHSDLTGTDDRCWGISEERIENVRRYFLAQGIEANRILSKAYGRSNPVWKKEKFEWQARENRRVDLIVYE